MTVTLYGRLAGDRYRKVYFPAARRDEAAALLRVMLAGLLAARDEFGDREIGMPPAISDAIAAARAAGVPET